VHHAALQFFYFLRPAKESFSSHYFITVIIILITVIITSIVFVIVSFTLFILLVNNVRVNQILLLVIFKFNDPYANAVSLAVPLNH